MQFRFKTFLAACAVAFFTLAPVLAEPVTDTQKVADHYNQVLARPEYQYNPEIDYVGQISNWLLSLLNSLNEGMSDLRYAQPLVGLSYLIMWGILILTVLALAYWAIKWARHYEGPEIDLRPRAEGKRFFAAPESYEPQIELALASGDWTGALRLNWLRFLSQLERHELVSADRTRTNWEYLSQLRTRKELPPQVNEIAQELVSGYDHHIYGAEPLPKDDWTQWYNSLIRVEHLLKLNRPSGISARTRAP